MQEAAVKVASITIEVRAGTRDMGILKVEVAAVLVEGAVVKQEFK